MREENERGFRIIQDQSRNSNMKKVQEMHHFFDNEHELLHDVRIRARILMLTKLFAILLIIIGTYGLFSTIRYAVFTDTRQIAIIAVLTIISGAVINLYTIWGIYRLKKARLVDRYNASDMLLYWLLDDDEVKVIRVEHNNRIIRMIRDDFSICLKNHGYKVIGQGKYVIEINLDEKTIVLGD